MKIKYKSVSRMRRPSWSLVFSVALFSEPVWDIVTHLRITQGVKWCLESGSKSCDMHWSIVCCTTLNSEPLNLPTNVLLQAPYCIRASEKQGQSKSSVKHPKLARKSSYHLSSIIMIKHFMWDLSTKTRIKQTLKTYLTYSNFPRYLMDQ